MTYVNFNFAHIQLSPLLIYECSTSVFRTGASRMGEEYISYKRFVNYDK
jgi:hypothetical protein